MGLRELEARRDDGDFMRFVCAVILFAIAILSPRFAIAGPGTIDALIVVDHQPNQVGGLSSDTELVTTMGAEAWQRGADDFVLSDATDIAAVRWWGFYNLDNPPVAETFRIRFYGARPGDGLPDESQIVYEQVVDTPTRTATGERVAVGVGPDEYLYETPFDAPVSLSSGVTYWLEVSQLGDLDTHFRWEFSQTDANGQAFINEVTVDWRATTLSSDTAFQLIAVPEPSAGLLLVALSLTVRLGRMRR